MGVTKGLLVGELGRNPLEYPIGFFLRDAFSFGAAYFHWNKNEESLLEEIRHDFVGLFPDDGEPKFKERMAEISSIIDDIQSKAAPLEELMMRVNDFMQDVAEIEWIGSFDNLCNANDYWHSEMRIKFRSAMVDADESLDENLDYPIKSEEIDAFAEFVSNFGM